MRHSMYFATISAISLANQLPRYSEFVLSGQFAQAHCAVDDLALTEQMDRPRDVAKLQAVGDLALINGRFEESEESFRRAQRVSVGNQALRILSCRNAAWQAVFRGRYAIAQTSFARIVNDQISSPEDLCEAHLGLVLIHCALGRRFAAANSIHHARTLLSELQDPKWIALTSAMAAELKIQYEIRTANPLADHAFWNSALACEPSPDAFNTIEMTDGSAAWSAIALLARRQAFLGHLLQLVRGRRQEILELQRSVNAFDGSVESQLSACIEISLAALGGGHQDIADEMLAMIKGNDAMQLSQELKLDLLYCRSRSASIRGDVSEALRLYVQYSQEALRWLRMQPPVNANERSQGLSGNLVQDDLVVRLPVRYRRAYRFIIENLNKHDLSTREIAAHIGVTERALQMTFQRILGTTPGGLIRRFRLEGIRGDLLDDTKISSTILETAQRWGVRSRSSLVKQYRKEFQESPSESKSVQVAELRA